MKSILVGLFLLAAAPAWAQPPIDAWGRDHLRWKGNERKADILSTVLVGVAVLEPCLLERGEHTSRKDCFTDEAIHIGAVVVLAELTKLLVHRTRPDGSDQKSFFSEHTAITCVATAFRKSAALCPGVAYLRVAANKHWITDTAAGAGVGFWMRVQF